MEPMGGDIHEKCPIRRISTSAEVEADGRRAGSTYIRSKEVIHVVGETRIDSTGAVQAEPHPAWYRPGHLVPFALSLESANLS